MRPGRPTLGCALIQWVQWVLVAFGAVVLIGSFAVSALDLLPTRIDETRRSPDQLYVAKIVRDPEFLRYRTTVTIERVDGTGASETVALWETHRVWLGLAWPNANRLNISATCEPPAILKQAHVDANAKPRRRIAITLNYKDAECRNGRKPRWWPPF